MTHKPTYKSFGNTYLPGNTCLSLYDTFSQPEILAGFQGSP